MRFRLVMASIVMTLMFGLSLGTASLVALADGLLTQDGIEIPFGISMWSQTINAPNEVVVNDPTRYEYAPAVVKAGNRLKMWYCWGFGRGDIIGYHYSDDNGATWVGPFGVLFPSDPNLVVGTPANEFLDAGHVCDPSVVREGDYMLLYYGGTPLLNHPDPTGCRPDCDTRVFVARVPVGSEHDPWAYEKYRFGGVWTSALSDQWTAPKPIVRQDGEAASLWSAKQINTPVDGRYGVGQPSAINIWGHRLHYTYNVAVPTQHVRSCVGTPTWTAWEAICSAYMASNTGNHVNYDVAYVQAPWQRYIATVGPEAGDHRPLIHFSHKCFWWHFANPWISRNLYHQSLLGINEVNGDLWAHNTGLLRDEYGYLVTAPTYDTSKPGDWFWVYYGTRADVLKTPSLGLVDIKRVGFSLSLPNPSNPQIGDPCAL